MSKRERNYGIDLLRIVSMYMVLILHILGKGGVLSAEDSSFAVHEAAWLLETLCFCAVNCYALISGYVGLHSEFRLSGILRLWLQAVFYTLLITVLISVFIPDVVGRNSWLDALLPVSTKQYWYLSAYVPVYFLTPFVNAGINALSAKKLGVIVFATAVLLMLSNVSPVMDAFVLKDGYSPIWLLYLYIIGGCIRKCGILDRLTTAKALLCYAVCVLMKWLPKLVTDSMNYAAGSRADHSLLTLKYTSPTVILAAVFLFAAFAKLDIGAVPRKMIVVLSPLAFGVYLIHTHPLIFENIIDGAFAGYADMPLPLMLLAVMGSSLGIFAVCMLVDFLRALIFRLIRINELSQWVDKMTEKYFGTSV